MLLILPCLLKELPVYQSSLFSRPQILDPVSALIIVDVQNDFISGTMAIRDCPAGQDGEAVVPVINELLDTVTFDLVVYSADWHPHNHISFIENVRQRKMHQTSRVGMCVTMGRGKICTRGPPGSYSAVEIRLGEPKFHS